MSSAFPQPFSSPEWATESNLVRILSITGVIHIVALLSVCLRLYCRIGLLRTPGKDDALIVGAVVRTPLLPPIFDAFTLTQAALRFRRMDLLCSARLPWSWATYCGGLERRQRGL